jgi:hypothetical protein
LEIKDWLQQHVVRLLLFSLLPLKVCLSCFVPFVPLASPLAPLWKVDSFLLACRRNAFFHTECCITCRSPFTPSSSLVLGAASPDLVYHIHLVVTTQLTLKLPIPGTRLPGCAWSTVGGDTSCRMKSSTDEQQFVCADAPNENECTTAAGDVGSSSSFF